MRVLISEFLHSTKSEIHQTLPDSIFLAVTLSIRPVP